jgi:hypothetical protein
VVCYTARGLLFGSTGILADYPTPPVTKEPMRHDVDFRRSNHHMSLDTEFNALAQFDMYDRHRVCGAIILNVSNQVRASDEDTGPQPNLRIVA